MPTTLRADSGRLATIPDLHVDALREALARHGYDGEMLGECEGWMPNQLDAIRVPLVLHELRRRDDEAAALARCFAYDDVLARGRIEHLLGADTVAALLDGNVLRECEDGVAARVRIIPFDRLWIASDDWAQPLDPVMGPGQTTLELARALDTTGVGSLLDVGCGAGSLALWGRSRGIPEAIGVDIDPRALDYARFNARLNRLPCEWRLGDLCAPVAGMRFDAVVCQPAYVSRPASVDAVTYLHGGARGDELALRLLGELPPLLADHGRAWVLFDTPTASPRELVARVRGALGDPAVDTIVLAPAGQSSRSYAIAYASLVDPQLGAGYRTAVEQYAAHFDALGIGAIRHLLVHVARAHGGRSSSIVLEPASLRAVDGELLAQIRAGAHAAARDDAALLAAAVVPVPDTWLVYEESLAGEPRTRSRVQFERGRGIDHTLSDTAAVLLQSLRDHQPLSAAIEAHAAAIDATPAEVQGGVLELVRRWLATGLLRVD